nr:helix-turn-helix transcriptional regulator [uncultured Shuttleworthia sp.]
MLKNNIEVDVKVKCIENATSQAKLASVVGTSPSYVNRLIKNPVRIVNKTFVSIMEKLGYDIEISYIKRDLHGGMHEND